MQPNLSTQNVHHHRGYLFLCITKKEVKVTKIQKAWNIVSDGNRHPVERRRDPSPTHKLRKIEK